MERASITWLVPSMGKSATDSQLASSPWLHLTTSFCHLKEGPFLFLTWKIWPSIVLNPAGPTPLKHKHSVKIWNAFNYVSTCDSTSIFFFVGHVQTNPIIICGCIKYNSNDDEPQFPFYETCSAKISNVCQILIFHPNSTNFGPNILLDVCYEVFENLGSVSDNKESSQRLKID